MRATEVDIGEAAVMRWRARRLIEAVASVVSRSDISFEAARQVVAAAQQPADGLVWQTFAERMESIEAVHLGRGWSGLEVVPGIEMRWRQGTDRYGLLMPLDVLIEQAGDLEQVPFYLQLAVDEPHGVVPDGARFWFQSLPSGPY